jgi:hypothetical protein
MLFVLTSPSEGVQRAPAYDGDIVGVYADSPDLVAAHGASSLPDLRVTVIPERADTFGEVWDAETALAGADIPARVDSLQHGMVEARGFLASVVAGELTNAPMPAPEPREGE